MALTTRDYKGILELIDLIYTVPDRALMFQEFCERLQKLAPISSAAYAPAEPKSSGFEFPGTIAFRAPMRPLYLFTSLPNTMLRSIHTTSRYERKVRPSI